MSDVKEETFYLARYALGKGEIEVVTGEWSERDPEWVTSKHGGWWSTFKIGREIFRTREEAVAKADELRKKKIASLHKQIKKLSEMVFK